MQVGLHVASFRPLPTVLSMDSFGQNVKGLSSLVIVDGHLTPTLTINIAPKLKVNQHHSSDLCLQLTYFHLYLEIFAHVGKLYKNVK